MKINNGAPSEKFAFKMILLGKAPDLVSVKFYLFFPLSQKNKLFCVSLGFLDVCLLGRFAALD